MTDTEPAQAKGYFTAAELARAAGCTLPTIAKHAARGFLAVEMTPGGVRRYPAAAMAAIRRAQAMLAELGIDPAAPFALGAALRYNALPQEVRDGTEFGSFLVGYDAATPGKSKGGG